jgi:alpha-beta hydrolase superfamily lysophospholipase
MIEGEGDSDEGRNIQRGRWPQYFRSVVASGRKGRGVVVIVPGFNSPSGYYAWVAEQFTAIGLAVYAVDLRGRGKSDGERFYVAKFADMSATSPAS